MDTTKPSADADADAAAPDRTPFTTNDHNNKSYKGVRKRKWGKWVSEIRLPNSRERIWLGSYDSPVKAARAFDAALYCLRGCRANFNFPDTPFNITDVVAGSLSPHQIQTVAANFANNCPNLEPPHTQTSVSNDIIINTNTNTISTMESSSSNDGAMQLEHGDSNDVMDWTFLNVLDDHSAVTDDVGFDGLYCDQIHGMHPEEVFYCTPPPIQFHHDNNVAQIRDDEYDDPFSHQSFLWNWNF